ncbi:DNA mismatch repair protein MutT [archaeon]|nr:DNA mismatch repair protein MutT [archaeon]
MLNYEELIEEAKKESIGRFVVAAIIVKNSKILLLKRKKDDFMGGIYELPSGKVEDNEEIDLSLKREIKEETGLKIKEIKKYFGFFDYESKSGKKTRQFNFLVETDLDDLKLSDEHEDFSWVSKTELSNFNITDSVKEVLAKVDFKSNI